MGVAGVALASILSQYLSAFLLLRLLLQSKEDFGLRPSCLRISRDKLKRLLQIGIPSAFQNAIFAIANLFVQTSVNSFDHVMVEGNSAAINADPLVYDMMAGIYTGCTSFMAQNLGAGKRDRVMKSYKICLLYSFLLGLVLGVGLYALKTPFYPCLPVMLPSSPQAIKDCPLWPSATVFQPLWTAPLPLPEEWARPLFLPSS